VKNLCKDQDLSYRETLEQDLCRDLREEIVSRLATRAKGTYPRNEITLIQDGKDYLREVIWDMFVLGV